MDNAPAHVPAARHAGRGIEAAPQVSIIVGGPPGARSACRVTAPDRVLRMWSLLNAAADELRQERVSPQQAERLERQLQTVITELEASLSPALAGELRRLVGQAPAAVPGISGLRVQLAGLIGWVGSLVVEMLSQLELAARRTRSGRSAEPDAIQTGAAAQPGAPAQPGATQPGATQPGAAG